MTLAPRVLRPRGRCPAALLAALALAAACSAPGDPPLLPRHRALYATLELRPDGPVLELESLTRFRETARFARDGTRLADDATDAWLEVEFRGDRDASGAFSAEIILRAPDRGWTQRLQLPPRSSGRWQRPLDGLPGATGLAIEIEPDPYYEMERMKPGGLPSAFGR